MIHLFLFVLGTVLGSFFLVVCTRLPLEQSIIKPRSHCDYCNKTLKWYELIPIFSYAIQLGKCRNCKRSLSILYPMIEILLGILFVVSYLLYGFTYEFFACSIIFCLLIIIFLTDFKYYMILDSPLVISSILIFLLKSIYFGLNTGLKSLLCGIILFFVVYLIKLLGDFIFKQESLGGGDVKLAFVLGVLLGLRLGALSYILSSFLALPYALTCVYFFQKKEVPFGPFIISAAMIIFLYMFKFTNLLNFFFFI